MATTAARTRPSLRIPSRADDATLRLGRRTVELTNLGKPFFPEAGYTKRDLLQYYADVSSALGPHLRDRAMVMKRYPNGIHGKCFFMKRTPPSHPEWLETCEISHKAAGRIAFPMVQDLASLLWIVNLGCIDLNPWYARCDDTDRPDYLHFDLDPGPGAPFARVREAALMVREALEAIGMTTLVKTSGSSGMHVYVPIVRGPVQKAVWRFAKRLAKQLERRHPALITAEYRIADRPRGRVLVDYNQNAWGRTLASVYSVRPTERATVSTPVTWREVERGVEIEDFRIDNVPARVRRLGDLWKPLLAARGRFRLEEVA
jgi:bifunctional non-homologous end joining protein LigD